MSRKNYDDFVNQLRDQVEEVMPWDVEEAFAGNYDGLVIDLREESEWNRCRIKGSFHVPRGVLEAAADWGYEESLQELIEAREKKVLLICRSGKRSVLAAHVLGLMGFEKPISLKTGIRGVWEADFPLYDDRGEVDEEKLEPFFYPDPPPPSGPKNRA